MPYINSKLKDMSSGPLNICFFSWVANKAAQKSSRYVDAVFFIPLRAIQWQRAPIVVRKRCGARARRFHLLFAVK